MPAQFERRAETDRPPVSFSVDGEPFSALQGDTLLIAMLCNMRRIRNLEFTGDPRAGFCLMAACQDCWVWLADGRRVRACSSLVMEGMQVLTSAPDGPWQNRP
jgi:aerobic-type carbon monoxide dehydrogenase small subunit (CoxS/CutS family)